MPRGQLEKGRALGQRHSLGIANLETKRGGAGAFWWRAWQERKRGEGQTQRGSIPNQRWERPTDTWPCKPDAVRPIK